MELGLLIQFTGIRIIEYKANSFRSIPLKNILYTGCLDNLNLLKFVAVFFTLNLMLKQSLHCNVGTELLHCNGTNLNATPTFLPLTIAP